MNLALKRAGNDDAPVISRWLNQPEIRRYLSSNLRHGEMSPALVRAGLRRRDQCWMLFQEAGQDAAGLIALDGIDLVDGVANLWFLLGRPELRRKGLASAAVAKFASDNPVGLHCLTAWVAAPNNASHRCLSNAGFRLAGRFAEAVFLDGHRYDRLLYQRILRPR